MRLPIRKADHLWHWGELDIQKKQATGISFEGRLFSMSAYPHAWREICPFGETPLHRCDSPVFLLDSNAIFFSLAYSAKRLAGAIREWGIEKGLLEHAFIYRVSEEDDEIGSVQQTFYRTAAQAELNAEDPEQIDGLDLVICTQTLNAINGFRPHDIVDESYVLIEWAKQYPQIQGIHWEDTFKRGAMAPRCGLFAAPPLLSMQPTELLDDQVMKKSVSKIQWLDVNSDFSRAFIDHPAQTQSPFP